MKNAEACHWLFVLRKNLERELMKLRENAEEKEQVERVANMIAALDKGMDGLTRHMRV